MNSDGMAEHAEVVSEPGLCRCVPQPGMGQVDWKPRDGVDDS